MMRRSILAVVALFAVAAVACAGDDDGLGPLPEGGRNLPTTSEVADDGTDGPGSTVFDGAADAGDGLDFEDAANIGDGVEEVAIEAEGGYDEGRPEEPADDSEPEDRAATELAPNTLGVADAFACGSAQLADGAVEDDDRVYATALLVAAADNTAEDQTVRASITKAAELLQASNLQATAEALGEALARCEQLGYER